MFDDRERNVRADEGEDHQEAVGRGSRSPVAAASEAVPSLAICRGCHIGLRSEARPVSQRGNQCGHVRRAAVASETMVVSGRSDESNGIGALDIGAGLGLLREVIIDAHVAQRGRPGRLREGRQSCPMAACSAAGSARCALCTHLTTGVNSTSTMDTRGTTSLKIGVLTFHRCINYGSYWQARFLVDALRERGHEAVLLDHYSPRVNIAEWKCALRPVLPTPVPKSDYPLYRRKIHKFFDAFAELPCSPCFSLGHPAGMERYDVIVIGRDRKSVV